VDIIIEGTPDGTVIPPSAGDAEPVGASEGGRPLGNAETVPSVVGAIVSGLQSGLFGGRTTILCFWSLGFSVSALNSLLFLLIARPFARLKMFIPRPPFFIFVVIFSLDGSSFTTVNVMLPFLSPLFVFFFVFFHIMLPFPRFLVLASLWTQTWSQLVPST
jgi:hypothetical protein